jgi:hypothetical protein
MSVLGNANSGRYSIPDLDAKLAVAKRTLDDAKRELSELSEIVFNDVALIPMRYEVLGPRLGPGRTFSSRREPTSIRWP